MIYMRCRQADDLEECDYETRVVSDKVEGRWRLVLSPVNFWNERAIEYDIPLPIRMAYDTPLPICIFRWLPAHGLPP